LNEAFNHWIVHRTPFVTVKAAMTMDGKIATASGESKWITGEQARACGMRLRQGMDAILVGINTVLTDDPRLTVRCPDEFQISNFKSEMPRRRIVLDSQARTPLVAKVVSDQWRDLTTIVAGREAPLSRIRALEKKVRVMCAPVRKGRIDLKWLLRALGKEQVTSLLVEGGGEVNESFLLGVMRNGSRFFYAPRVLGGLDARKAVGGQGVARAGEMLQLEKVEWRRAGEDLMLEAKVQMG
jgi:diaminohydroxyphosphoribosylaminopyrimidine deaminase/5-amino-6-(5-phosphoribosylamino)uracil reductase